MKDDKKEIHFSFDNYSDLKNSYNQETLVELLRELQEEFGYISEKMQKEVAEYCNIKETVVQSIIKRYPSLKLNPYKHRIVLCMGAACQKNNCSLLKETIEKELKNRPSDLFELTTVNCLKNCKTAPNLRIDNDIYKNVQVNEIKELLDKYKSY